MDLLKNKNSLDEGYLLHWYEITDVIGRGGFGITYLAHDQNLDRSVAIKEYMPEDFALRESDGTITPKSGEQKKLYIWGLERFIAEARTLAIFNHPNIVRVLSVFEANNTAYMVMEYAQGKDLSVVYKDAPKFTQDQLLDTFIPILDGLSLVHNAGFIHRDIKPANIYICDNESPLLLDFGSARQSLGGKTQALTSLVTYGYAPYEQYNQGTGKQGPWTDIYSLGASIYYGITGNKPMDALVRGGGFLEKGIDAYEPISILAKGDYSENFLLAIDNALMFKLEARPENVIAWADMLLGKVSAPALPEFMTRYAENDETVVRPWPTAGSAQNVSVSKKTYSGGQGLIDASGRRHLVHGDVQPTNLHTHREEEALKESLSKIDYSGQPATESKKTNRLLFVTLLVCILSVALFLSADYLKNQLTISNSSLLSFIKQKTQNTNLEKPDDLQTKQLHELLSRAQQSFKAGNFVVPKNENAYRYYLNALNLDPDNKAAKRGLKNIQKKLLDNANAAYIEKRYKKSLGYLNQLKKISPNSSSAKLLRNKLSLEQNKSNQISRWLKLAEAHKKNNRYTSPPNINAYEVYEKILKRQSDNKQALLEIKKIQQYYKSLFKRHIAASRLSSAERDIKVMKKIKVSLSEIKKMQNTLKLKQRKQVVNNVAKDSAIKNSATKKLTIKEVSKQVSKFKNAIELGHKSRLKQISQFAPGREQFVNRLLGKYKTINVNVSRLKLISHTNSAQAYVELTYLVDKKGNKIVAGDWRQFEIGLGYDINNELKVNW